MRMQHIRRLVSSPAGFQDRATEEDEALQVVGVVAALLAVESSTAEERIVTDAYERDGLVFERAGLNPDPYRAAAEGDRHGGCLTEVRRLGLDPRVAREGQLDLVTQARQLDRQRSCHIRQASRLGQRDRLAREHQDAHGTFYR